MNKPLLTKVAKYILKNPKKYDQNNECGSSMCIGGLAIFLSDLKSYKKILEAFKKGCDGCDFTEWAKNAKKILDLNDKQFKILCGIYWNWPAKFRDAYQKAEKERDYKKMAKVGYERIMHFIKTGK